MSAIPTNSSAIKRPDLIPTAVKTRNQTTFAHHKLLPPFPSATAASYIAKIMAEDYNKVRNTAYAEGPTAKATLNADNIPFATSQFVLTGYVKDRDISIYSNYFDLEQETTNLVVRGLNLSAEQNCRDLFFNQAIPIKVTNKWTVDNDQIETDTDLAEQHLQDHGMRPNFIAMTRKALKTTARNKYILSFMKLNPNEFVKKTVSEKAKVLASFFDVDEIIVLDTLKYDEMQNKHVSLWEDAYIYIGKRSNESIKTLKDLSIGRSIHFNALHGKLIELGDDEIDDNLGFDIETYRIEDEMSNAIRVKMDMQQIILHPEAVVKMEIL